MTLCNFNLPLDLPIELALLKLRPTLEHMVTSFPKRIAILGRKLEATNAAPMDADHIFGRG